MGRWNNKRQDLYQATISWLKRGEEFLMFKISKQWTDLDAETDRVYGRLSNIGLYEKEFEWEKRTKMFLRLEDKKPIQLTWGMNKVTVNLINSLVNLTEEQLSKNITISLYIKDWYKNVSIWCDWNLVMGKHDNSDLWEKIEIEKNSKGKITDIDYSWFVEFIKDDINKLKDLLWDSDTENAPDVEWDDDGFAEQIEAEAEAASETAAEEKAAEKKDSNPYNDDDDLPF